MSIIKITELPSATSPVSASDVVPAVQNGVTKKAAINQLGFQPAGTNAVTRTLQDKAREVVSVKDFGAKGDGITDDTTAIENAVQYLKSVGGGVCFFPRGTYLITYAISIVSNVHYLGEERDATILKASDSSIDNILGWAYPLYPYLPLARAAGGTINRLTKPDFITYYTEEEALINGGFSLYSSVNVLIENITFDGNKNNRQEGDNFLKGTLTGTFLSGEVITSSSGGSAISTGTFNNTGVVIEPRTITGTFNIGDTITGAESGKTMVISSKEADDAYQLCVRFDGVSHSTVRNCVFTRSIFTAMSIYNWSNYDIVEKCLFYDNHKAGTVYPFGYINIYIEFDNNYCTVQDNLIIGGLGYSILVSSNGGTNRDTTILNNVILNNHGDGIRVALDAGVWTILSPKVIGNTVINCTAAGATGIRFFHAGVSGGIIDGVISGNQVRQCPNGILTQGGGTIRTTVVGNTVSNIVGGEIGISGIREVCVANTADASVSEFLTNPLTITSETSTPLKLYRDGGSVGLELDVANVGTWRTAATTGGEYWLEFGGARKASIDGTGNFQAIKSIAAGRSSLQALDKISIGTSPTTFITLTNPNNPVLLIVAGDDGNNGFIDLVVAGYTNVAALTSTTLYGSPAARTYSLSGSTLRLAMASGAYNILPQALQYAWY